jgi:hypothetical protein
MFLSFFLSFLLFLLNPRHQQAIPPQLVISIQCVAKQVPLPYLCMHQAIIV